MSKQLKVVLAQLNFLVGDINGNTNRIIDSAKHAQFKMGADVIIFPELAICGYPPEDLLLKSSFIDQIDRSIERICHSVKNISVVLGCPVRENNCLYNVAIVISDGEVVARYRKQFLPNYSVFDEKRYFACDDEACVVTINGVKVGMTICEDIWYNEPTEKAVQQGAELIFNINASPFHISKISERIDVVRQRVYENSIPIVYVNLVGGQDELVFDGTSFIINAQGQLLYEAPSFEEDLYCIQLDLNSNELQCGLQLTSGRHRELENIYKALVLGVKDYVKKNKFPGVLIGLSGGIDSALTLAIAVDALGSQKVEAVLMPSRYTSDMSIHDAIKEAETLQVKHHTISIEPNFSGFLESLHDVFAGNCLAVTEENIQARCRGILLMALSNNSGKMVLTTGNKSEMAVGYATLYGDMAGGYNALKDVAKTLVYRLAEYRNSLSVVIPESVIHRAPSAELAADQIDADTLPDYGVLDEILELYVEKDYSIEEIILRGFDSQTVRRVIRMVDLSEYKRRQAAPGVRITRRAFGLDRRYPITSGHCQQKA
ncbi:MAG: NAD+ synthase [Thiohalomonadales bacterium]